MKQKYPVSVHMPAERAFKGRAVQEAVVRQMADSINSMEEASKSKYKAKEKLIIEDENMSNQEKLDALDHNYIQRNQEQRQNLIEVLTVVALITGAALGGPKVIKTAKVIRKLIQS